MRPFPSAINKRFFVMCSEHRICAQDRVRGAQSGMQSTDGNEVGRWKALAPSTPRKHVSSVITVPYEKPLFWQSS